MTLMLRTRRAAPAIATGVLFALLGAPACGPTEKKVVENLPEPVLTTMPAPPATVAQSPEAGSPSGDQPDRSADDAER